MYSQDLTDGLLLEYTFDNTTDDSSGNNFHAINNGAVFVQDRFGNENSAILFDGIDDFLELPNVSELKPQLPLSFSFWIRYDSDLSTDRDVFNTSFEEDRSSGVFFNSQSSTSKYAVNFGDGDFSYTASTRRTYVTDSFINTGVWAQVVVVVNSATDMLIYVNCDEKGGVFSGSGGDLVYSDTPGNIGRHDRDLGLPANYFKGAIDDFRYWDRALTQGDVNILCGSLSIVESTVEENLISIYPNPSKGMFNISTTKKIEKVEIYNALGQIVYKNNFKKEMDLSHLSKGVYMVKFINDKSSAIRRIIIE